jgi:hypothetical protein
MRKVIDVKDVKYAFSLIQAGVSDRQIAKQGVLGRPLCGKLRKAMLQNGWIPEDKECAKPLNELLSDDDLMAIIKSKSANDVTPGEKSKAFPFRDRIKQLAEEHYNGRNIHKVLSDQDDYDGSYSGLMRDMGVLGISLDAKKQANKSTMIRIFNPGDGVEIDFCDGPKVPDVNGEMKKTWCFVAVFRYSRHLFLRFIPACNTEQWIDCHIRAFDFFGGVPKYLYIDNPKCAVIKAHRTEPVLNEEYKDCVIHYKCRVDALPPRSPKLKGIVERTVQYIQTSFLNLNRNFRSLADLNEKAAEWNRDVASVRKHGTTGFVPIDVFNNIEKELLLPLPEIPFENCKYKVYKIHPDGHYECNHVRYSVPYEYEGKKVKVKITATQMIAYYDGESISIHNRSNKRYEFIQDPAHLKDEDSAYNSFSAQNCLKIARQAGKLFYNVVEYHLKENPINNLRYVQGLCRLVENYGAKNVEQSCELVARLGLTLNSYNIKRCLNGKLTAGSKPKKQLDAVYRGGGMFGNPNDKKE